MGSRYHNRYGNPRLDSLSPPESIEQYDRRQFEAAQSTGDPVTDAVGLSDSISAKIDEENAGSLPDGYEWDLAYHGPGRRLMKPVYADDGITLVGRTEVRIEE